MSPRFKQMALMLTQMQKIFNAVKFWSISAMFLTLKWLPAASMRYGFILRLEIPVCRFTEINYYAYPEKTARAR